MAQTVQYFVEHLVDVYGERPALISRSGYRRKVWSYRDVYEYAHRIAAYLHERGLRKGDKLLIYAPNSPDWVGVLLACSITGIIAVPMDFSAETAFPKRIYAQVGAKLAVVSRAKPLGRLDDGRAISEVFAEELHELTLGHRRADDLAEVLPGDILEIVYTSGTTSDPKGVIVTNENITANIHAFGESVPMRDDLVFLSIIPLSHMFEQTVGCFVALRFGCRICYIPSRKSTVVVEAMREERVTSVVTVPIFLELFRERILQEAQRQGKASRLERARHAAARLPSRFRRVVFRGILRKLGMLKMFVVGGAPLSQDVERFWDDIGVLVLQGYGMTETGPIIACNTPRDHRIGSVGRALPGQELRIAPDGEIQCRGPNVTPGYYENPEATAALFSDGWLCTGDIGDIDEQGFLIIKGRKKNMIVSGSGMKVYPEDVEREIAGTGLVRDSCVLGHSKPGGGDIVITAVVLPHDGKPVDEHALLQAVNGRLSAHQQVQQVIVWPDADFPRTPSLKIIRRKIEARLSTGAPERKGDARAEQDALCRLVARVTGTTADVTPEKSLVNDLGVDSLHRVELLAAIEEEFNVELQDEQVTPATTVADLRSLIGKAGPRESVRVHWLQRSRLVRPVRALVRGAVLLVSVPFSPLTVKGAEHVRSIKGPCVIIANHTSHFDTPLILRALPRGARGRVAFAAAQDYFFPDDTRWHRVRGWLLRLALNLYPFSRTGDIRSSLQLTGRLLDRGAWIVLYPEGTRTTTGEMDHFKAGVGLIASAMEVPVVPVRIDGVYAVLPKGRRWPRRAPVTVTFGEPYLAKGSQSYLEIAEALEGRVRNL